MYKIYKLAEDRRNHTCGYMIPNGGFYWVVEMTFENHQQLVHLSERPGYSVDYVEGDAGFFDADGFEVDPDSVVIDKLTKQVVEYQKKTKKWGGKEKEIKKEHKGSERDKALQEARSRGFKVSEEASTQTIKYALSVHKRAPQSTVGTTLS